MPLITLEMGPEYFRTVAELDSLGHNLIRACSDGLEKGVQVVAGKIARDYLSGQALRSRSGMLRRHVNGWLDSPLEAVIGVKENTPVDNYKWLLGDETKTITPKKGKFLTIPIGENLTGAGVPRFISPRQVPDGFFVNKNGRLLFGYKKGTTGRGKFRPLFVLVKSVVVQGSGALYDGTMDNLDDIAAAMQTEVDKAIGD